MRTLRILLATSALSLGAVPSLACPFDGLDGGEHRYFAFAGQLQDRFRPAEPARDRDQRAPQGGGASGKEQPQPQPDQSNNPESGPADSTDAATFR